ncbi:MAG TPA: LemA family protein, partial [Armatimonadota bacterium]|nr:LemA family protein [Armatimonadota bacterium]
MEVFLPVIAIVALALLLPIIWFIGTYNGFVRARNTCDESWSDIDTELRRRYDLIPNLVNTVQGYATHEKELFERVVQARTAAMANHGSPESQ